MATPFLPIPEGLDLCNSETDRTLFLQLINYDFQLAVKLIFQTFGVTVNLPGVPDFVFPVDGFTIPGLDPFRYTIVGDRPQIDSAWIGGRYLTGSPFEREIASGGVAGTDGAKVPGGSIAVPGSDPWSLVMPYVLANFEIMIDAVPTMKEFGITLPQLDPCTPGGSQQIIQAINTSLGGAITSAGGGGSVVTGCMGTPNCQQGSGCAYAYPSYNALSMTSAASVDIPSPSILPSFGRVDTDSPSGTGVSLCTSTGGCFIMDASQYSGLSGGTFLRANMHSFLNVLHPPSPGPQDPTAPCQETRGLIMGPLNYDMRFRVTLLKDAAFLSPHPLVMVANLVFSEGAPWPGETSSQSLSIIRSDFGGVGSSIVRDISGLYFFTNNFFVFPRFAMALAPSANGNLAIGVDQVELIYSLP